MDIAIRDRGKVDKDFLDHKFEHCGLGIWTGSEQKKLLRKLKENCNVEQGLQIIIYWNVSSLIEKYLKNVVFLNFTGC